MPRQSKTLQTDQPFPASTAWQSLKAVPLLRNVQRLTAPNPGVMTGPGTNSYLVGEAKTGFVVIDPGPNDAGHLLRLWETAVHADGSGGNIRTIICTHSHPDHSPGAYPLQALCSNKPELLGLPSASTAKITSKFIPERSVRDGEQIELGDTTLLLIHTPGHAANHVCLLLIEDGVLLSGDHILNGSTTIVDPPDGNMTDYLNSLEKLKLYCEKHSVSHVLPAHGEILSDALRVIEQLRRHRLQRESKIIRVMKANPDATMEQWLEKAYDDVPESVLPLAYRSMLAHVERISALGLDKDS